MINNVTLVGRLTKDCDLRYTANGTAVAAFTLAVNRNFTNKNGEREADYVSCVIWRKPAETLANYTRKGTLIGIVGRLQTRNYENQQGQRVYVTEVVVETFQLLESKEVSQQRGANASNHSPIEQRASNTQQPFPDTDPFTNSGSSIEISDDDLPF
ncbi:TPA: single-stranded DNA-binding protein [Enterococcus faecalis]|uniref:single-stranded DNA-binding protein n=1 Tax=Enterococcus faecalis TaxID=1351 RepID=UPI0022E60257|nr:single-stranded DNA-binding protein [Enterococcus faecalis]HAP4186030.1 single-stranded DNA-binding protein [Enterococcus faecalis]